MRLLQRFGSGALAGRRIADLLIAFLGGVVSRVSRPLAALTALRALTGKKSEDDLTR